MVVIISMALRKKVAVIIIIFIVIFGAFLLFARFLSPPFDIQRPSVKASGEWIFRFQAWIHQGINGASDRRKVIYSSCASPRNDGVWFLSPTSPSSEVIRACQVKVGATFLFPAISELSIGNRDNCVDMVKNIREEIQRHRSNFSVYIDGSPLAPSAFWSNGSVDCFPLDTGWGGFGIQRADEDKTKYLTHAYSDGYWVMVTFNTPGIYSLRVIQLPHQRWQWNESYSLDVTYTIHVIDQPARAQ
jgi:hypothetical protein